MIPAKEGMKMRRKKELVDKLKKENEELRSEIEQLKDTGLVKELIKGLSDIKCGRVIIR